jgi:rhamnopyranosyl-N-acetylglucosaminyl-diphospho-decaprenol beta-1,3/1,4-galactofuranosyltransferase
MNTKVCSIVVTFNRSALLKEVILGLVGQNHEIGTIIIIDNASSDDTTDVVSKLAEKYDSIQYVRLSENLGGSGGFHEGFKNAVNCDAEWLWVLDDDVVPEVDCLEKMLNAAPNEECALCPKRDFPDGRIFREFKHHSVRNILRRIVSGQWKPEDYESKKLVKISTFAFEGPLIPMKVVKKLGMPVRDYFILWDDTEYALRLAASGIPIYLVPDAILHKKLMAKRGASFGWKEYYYVRNRYWVEKRFVGGWLYLLRPTLYVFRYILASVIRRRRFNLKNICKAMRDGVLTKRSAYRENPSY